MNVEVDNKQTMVNKKRFGCFAMVIMVVAVLVVSFAIFVLIDFLQRMLLLGNSDWIFFETAPYAQRIIIFTVVILLMEAFGALVYKRFGNSNLQSSYAFMQFVTRHKTAVILLCIALLYAGFTGISSVDADGVTRRSALKPGGRTYDLELISSVDTGFTRGGDFYYNINVDGRTLKFGTPTVNTVEYPEYAIADYKQFLDLDEKLTALGIPKNADSESLKYANYDEVCMQYLRSILEG